ncbi:NACHT domain-containing protein [Streptomyces sp. A7024]|uniref:NACHT domain-containing protein n=1 Tax=Streptomyces coryli TaxID=1128680 RepID=A0A6G4U435_9ACTN|nr:NACHT domain-containing protein [Streptomyces coryli]NGN66772.1 NACHT domain-containing protein [Streptomyces coryli]
MDLSLVIGRLTQRAVEAAITKIFVEKPGAGYVDTPIRIRRWLPQKGASTLTERDLDKIAAELVRRAVGGGGGGAGAELRERPIAADEDQAVTDALARTLHAMGEVEMDDVQALGLRPDAFAAELRSRAPDVERELTEEGTLLYRLLLELAARHILEFFSKQKQFETATLVAYGQYIADLEDRYTRLADRLPSRTSEDAAFERRYKRDIAVLHNQLTIYGIDLAHSPRSWPLDTAYLDLRCEPTDPASSEPGLPVSLELKDRTRVLVRGEAGSGKTTLLQWLAVCTARGELPGDLSFRVPFLLPVRRFAHEGFPAPEQFLEAAGYPRAGSQPPGWADRVLTAGRGLLLIDGVDEAPEAEREQLKRLLGDWNRVYPGNVWLVTTRPSAVPEDWLREEDFGELQLAPMGREEVASFIRRWHRSAREAARRALPERTAAGAEPADATPSDAILLEHDLGVLDHHEQSLLKAVRITRDLGRLATNPLMCGLLCALHLDRNGYLPRGRKDLYEAAMSMLLERRDPERAMAPVDGIDLQRQPKVRLLHKLAHWMLVNGRSEMKRSTAIRTLAEHLPAVPDAAGHDAETIYRHLLDRTGLLREPTPDTVDFIHRTFQDYLAAEAAVQREDFDLLLNNSHRTDWEDVIRMAFALARPAECADLLDRMIGPTSRDLHGDAGPHRKLLAAACLEHISEIDPAVRARVERYARSIVQPNDPVAARRLGWMGPIVLEILHSLHDTASASDDDALLLAITATSVRDEMAIDYLTGLRDRTRHDIRAELAGAWHRYDTGRYAKEIIAHLGTADLFFPVSDAEEAKALADLKGRPLLKITGNLDPEELTEPLAPTHLTNLWLHYDLQVTFEWLSSFKSLHTLHVSDGLPAPRGVPEGIRVTGPPEPPTSPGEDSR